MKVLILAFVAVAYAAPNAHHVDPSDFAKWLQEIEQSKEYMAMTDVDKQLFQDLIMAAQKGATELNSFITSKSFETILNLADHLDEDDIKHFEEMLAYYSDPNIFTGSLNVHKRQGGSNMDLYTWIHELHEIQKIEEDLHKEDRIAFMRMMNALEHDTLTNYISQVGYAEVLKILSKVDKDEAHDLDRMIEMHLEKEKTMGHIPIQGTTMDMGMTTIMSYV